MSKDNSCVWVDVDQVNAQQREAFCKIPVCQRLFSVPHCLAEDLRKEIIAFAQQLGYHVSIAEGGTDVENDLKNIEPGAIVGIACQKEIWLAIQFLKIPFQAIELISFGCKKHNSTFDMAKAKAILARGS